MNKEDIKGINGAALAFVMLKEDFDENKHVKLQIDAYNPYTFMVDDSEYQFLTVYDHEDDVKHTVRLSFGPGNAWDAVMQNLFVNYQIDLAEFKKRRISGSSFNVVTLQFYDQNDTDEILSEDEMILLRKVADAVVDALVELEEEEDE